MGKIETYHGNNLVYLKKMQDKEFDLLFDDPPYGIKESAHRNISRTKLAKTRMYRKEVWDQKIPPQQYFNHDFRISRQQIIWGVNYFVGKRKFAFSSGRIVWDKVNGESNFSDCELAYCSYHHTTRLFRFMWNGMLQGKSCVEGHRQQGNKDLNQKRIHPTEKPVEINKLILLKYAQKGYRIIEPHAGSFSLALAVEYLNKHHNMDLSLVSIEIDPVYYKDGTERLFEQQRIQVLNF